MNEWVSLATRANSQLDPKISNPTRIVVGSSLTAMSIILAFVAQWPLWPQTPVYALGNLTVTVFCVLTGYIGWVKRERRPLAFGLVVSGFLWSLQWMTSWDSGPLPIIGVHVNSLFYVVAGVTFLVSFRTQGLRRSDKWLIGAFVLPCVAQPFVVMTSDPTWFGFSQTVWWPSIWVDRAHHQIVLNVFIALWVMVGLWFAVAAWSCFKELNGLDRVVALPTIASFALVSICVSTWSNIEPFPTTRISSFYFVLSLMCLLAPLGLVLSMLRGRLQKVILTEQISMKLAQPVLTGELVRAELRFALSDPTIEVLYWSDDLETYVSVDGHPHADAMWSGTRYVSLIEDKMGEPMAAVVGDASLMRHREAVDSVIATSALALQNVQLQASIRHQLEEVRASRIRLVEAAVRERRNIARDLHDGVQQRLLALHAQVGNFRRVHAGNPAEDDLTYVSGELRSVAADLRDIAHGIHPSELRQFGVSAALEVMLDRLPIPVEATISLNRYSPAVEAIVYFSVSEAIANVVKHAQAQLVAVDVREGAGTIRVTVSDDGVGGVEPRRGGGLEGLADRVKTVGGSVEFSSSRRSGTTLMVSIPT